MRQFEHGSHRYRQKFQNLSRIKRQRNRWYIHRRSPELRLIQSTGQHKATLWGGFSITRITQGLPEPTMINSNEMQGQKIDKNITKRGAEQYIQVERIDEQPFLKAIREQYRPAKRQLEAKIKNKPEEMAQIRSTP